MQDKPLIYCAADTPHLDKALALAAGMQRAECGLKLGLEFFNGQGPQGIRDVRDAYPDLSLFVDLKFHDIPNTVAGAVRAITQLSPDYINVHASGGLEMMKAARLACAETAEMSGSNPTRLLAVTLLTSMDAAAFAETGLSGSIEDQVVRLAVLAREAGLDGVVCSAHEIAAIRAACGKDFVLMVPGIRPVTGENGTSGAQAAVSPAPLDDQRRVMAPAEALALGATHLVIGRPITRHAAPAEAAMDIMRALSAQKAA